MWNASPVCILPFDSKPSRNRFRPPPVTDERDAGTQPSGQMSPQDETPRRLNAYPSESNGDASSGTSWFAKLVPESLARRGLVIEVRAPETLHLDERRAIYVIVRNRLPVPITVSTPTSRLWGWDVDGVPEADRRSFTPPETGRTVRFGGLQRKVFEATWDGRMCEQQDSQTRWVDSPGTHTVTGYLAIDRWKQRGLYDETEITVVER